MVWHQYTVRVPQGRDELAAWLRERDIEAAVYYPHTLPASRSTATWATTRRRSRSRERWRAKCCRCPSIPALSARPTSSTIVDGRERLDGEHGREHRGATGELASWRSASSGWASAPITPASSAIWRACALPPSATATRSAWRASRADAPSTPTRLRDDAARRDAGRGRRRRAGAPARAGGAGGDRGGLRAARREAAGAVAGRRTAPRRRGVAARACR